MVIDEAEDNLKKNRAGQRIGSGDIISGDKITVGDINGSYVAIGHGAQVLVQQIKQALSESQKIQKDYQVEIADLALAVGDYVQKLRNQIPQKGRADEEAEPYKSLLPYGLADAPLFFGREAAKRELLTNINRRDMGRLTVLHAESGAGKTSLLQAGLGAELLAEGHLPLYVRAWRASPAEAIKQTLLPDLQKTPRLAETPLRAFLQHVTLFLGGSTTLFILLDQCEEFFIHLTDEAARQAFIDDLGACVDDKTLPVRFILALRNEYFAELSDFKARIPFIFANEYNLKLLKRSEARQAIVEPAMLTGLAYEKGLVDTMLDELQANGQKIINPAQLQLVCWALYRGLVETETRIITPAALAEMGGVAGILRHYLRNVIEREFPFRLREQAQAVIESLVRSNRTRDIKTISEIAHDAPPPEHLGRILGDLVNSRLVQVDEDDPDREATYELAHDYLIEQIDLDPEVLARKAAQELLDQEVAAWLANPALRIGEEKLKVIRPQADKLHFTPEAKELYDLSVKAQRRRRWLFFGLLGLVVAAAILASFFFVTGEGRRVALVTATVIIRSAEEAADVAETRQSEAEAAQVVAETAQHAAEAQKVAAEEAGATALVAKAAAEVGQQTAVAARSTAEVAKAAAEAEQAQAELDATAAAGQAATARAAEATARSAGATAEIARTTAEAAERTAITARDAAEASQATAEAEQALAVTAEQVAIAARETARAGQATAVVAQQTAEAEEATAVAAQQAAEAAAEAARQAQAEAVAAQATAEAARTAAEQARLEAEAARDQAQEQMNQAHATATVVIATKEAAEADLVRTQQLAAIIGSIQTCPLPDSGSALTYDGSHIWVVSRGANAAITKFSAGDCTKVLGAYPISGSATDVIYAGGYIWVSDLNGNTVRKIDPQSGNTLDPFPVPGGPPGSLPAALVYDGHFLWVASSNRDNNQNKIRKIDPNTGADQGTFDIGANPVDLVYDGQYIWVANFGSASVSRIDVGTGNSIDSFPVGEGPSQLLYDGTYIWVANRGSNTVTRLRAADGTEATTFLTNGRPVALAFDGANIWSANQLDNTVARVRLSEDAALFELSSAKSPTDMLFDGANLWVVADDDAQVQRMPISYRPVGHGPTAIDFDGANLWVTNQRDGTISQLSLTIDGLTKTYPTGGEPIALAVTDSHVWAANVNNSTITKIRSDNGLIEHTFLLGPGIPRAVTFDGAYIWVINSNNNTVTRIHHEFNEDVATFSRGDELVGVLYDGHYIWLADAGDKKLLKLNAEGDQIKDHNLVDITPEVFTYDGTYFWIGYTFISFPISQIRLRQIRASDDAVITDTPTTAKTGLTAITYDGRFIWLATQEALNAKNGEIIRVAIADPTEQLIFLSCAGPSDLLNAAGDIWVACQTDNLVQKLFGSRNLLRASKVDTPGSFDHLHVIYLPILQRK